MYVIVTAIWRMTAITGVYYSIAYIIIAYIIITAIIAAIILHKTLKVKSTSFFVVEMPDYKLPSLKNVFFDVVEKTNKYLHLDVFLVVPAVLL